MKSRKEKKEKGREERGRKEKRRKGNRKEGRIEEKTEKMGKRRVSAQKKIINQERRR